MKTAGYFILGVWMNRMQKCFILSAKKKEIVIKHTEVNEELEGKGIGKELVKAAVDYAKSGKMKVIPLCSFVGSILSKEPAYQGVLKMPE
ncbi:MAG: GNAT family N-acetyltransferase [Chitinophagaceae bacterium]